MEREALCRIVVMAGGEKLSQQAAALSEGELISVTGFISRADSRQGQARLVLHAQSIRRV